jgi:hypothetical protein
LYYCDMGIRAVTYREQGADEEKQLYNDHDCDMVLCHECKNIRQKAYLNGNTNVETVGRPTRTSHLQNKQL